MNSNASCPGPCRRPDRCPCLPPAAFAAACLLLSVLAVAHGVRSARLDAGRRLDALSAALAARADRLAHGIAGQGERLDTARIRIIALGRSLAAESAGRAASDEADGRRFRAESDLRARIDAGLAVNLADAIHRLDALEARPGCKCRPPAPQPVPRPAPAPQPTPETPPLPGKGLPEAIPPAASR